MMTKHELTSELPLPFFLPDAAIAREPLRHREHARLLVLERDSGRTHHRRLADLPNILGQGHHLVLNDSRVEAPHLQLPSYLAHYRADGRVPTFYNTDYARTPGSAAPPSAGLNLTDHLIDELDAAGVTRSTLTLHVHGTRYSPPEGVPVASHRIPGERFVLRATQTARLRDALAVGRRLVAVGTTVTRTLEHVAQQGGLPITDATGVADLMIRPGHRFRLVDGLLTGFHGPRTTLFYLVAALAGLEPLVTAYREALSHGYRWYTLGDSMLIL